MLAVLQRERPSRVPFWLMRQAGRYLPEYRELRANKGGFLDLVYDPEAASEVTLQPIRRFGMDGAILFSDILVVPQALGQHLEFTAGEGPKLDPVANASDLQKLNISSVSERCQPVYETVQKVREKLQREGFDQTTLIGFCGGPWTVACYMVQGGGSADFARAKNFAASDADNFQILIDLVTEAGIEYLCAQIHSGAEAIQIFESWAGLIADDEFHRWVIAPTKKIVDAVKKKYPHVPVIGFARGASAMLEDYALLAGVDALQLDQTIDLGWATTHLKKPLQGNLDPEILLSGGAGLEKEMAKIRAGFGDKPFIFNLGHGVIKETPVEHVQKLADIVRGWTP